ncbi:MAG TPA: SMI1/KNR4 family protein [Chitinophagaceae bacterium]
MTHQETYEQVLDKINWISKIAIRKNWEITRPLYIDRPATMEEIQVVEKHIGQTIPRDLKELFTFAKHLSFSYQFDETLSQEFRQNFSGEIYWNLNTLSEQYDNFKEWVKISLDPKFNDTDSIEITEKLWQNKLPLIDVPNGDIIVVGNSPSEVLYFSHEGDTMHGKMLGENLWQFLDFYSRIGFAGSEDWQLEPFFDYDKNIMVPKGEKVDRFINLLDN